MNEDLWECFDQLESLVRDLAKQFRDIGLENKQLHGLVSAMEADNKKAVRLIMEHEKLLGARERAKEKISELIEKFDRLRI